MALVEIMGWNYTLRQAVNVQEENAHLGIKELIYLRPSLVPLLDRIPRIQVSKPFSSLFPLWAVL